MSYLRCFLSLSFGRSRNWKLWPEFLNGVESLGLCHLSWLHWTKASAMSLLWNNLWISVFIKIFLENMQIFKKGLHITWDWLNKLSTRIRLAHIFSKVLKFVLSKSRALIESTSRWWFREFNSESGWNLRNLFVAVRRRPAFLKRKTFPNREP